MLLQVILEGLGLGALLFLVCAVGIRKGAVGMVHLYSPAVQQRCGQQIGFAQIVQFQLHGRVSPCSEKINASKRNQAIMNQKLSLEIG